MCPLVQIFSLLLSLQGTFTEFVYSLQALVLEGHWRLTDLGLNPSPAACWLCDMGRCLYLSGPSINNHSYLKEIK